jgi:hypothetical protein
LKITGLKKENFVGKLIQDVAVNNDLVRDIIKEMIVSDKTNSEKETMKIYADGKESYFEKEIVDINIIPTGEQQSRFIGQVIMLRNITPFKELDLAKTNFWERFPTNSKPDFFYTNGIAAFRKRTDWKSE